MVVVKNEHELEIAIKDKKEKIAVEGWYKDRLIEKYNKEQKNHSGATMAAGVVAGVLTGGTALFAPAIALLSFGFANISKKELSKYDMSIKNNKVYLIRK